MGVFPVSLSETAVASAAFLECPIPLWNDLDKLLLRKRALIESVGEQLKHVCQIAHTRHRSVHNASLHLLAALVAYTWHEHKPSLHLIEEECDLLAKAF